MNRCMMPFVLCVLLLSAASAAAAEPPTPPPQWLLDHMKFMIEPDGVWITDNGPFRSEQEPFEQYGTDWEWGVGNTTLRGRLFGLVDGTETEFWEYRVFWDPKSDEATMIQFGRNGVLGMGPMWLEDDGTLRSEMTFWYPGRGSERVAHDLFETDANTHLTRSFGWSEGEWKPRREYVWKRRGGDMDSSSATLNDDETMR